MLNNPSGPSAEAAPGSSNRGGLPKGKASFLDYRRQEQHSKDIGEHPYDRGHGTFDEYMGRQPAKHSQTVSATTSPFGKPLGKVFTIQNNLNAPTPKGEKAQSGLDTPIEPNEAKGNFGKK